MTLRRNVSIVLIGGGLLVGGITGVRLLQRVLADDLRVYPASLRIVRPARMIRSRNSKQRVRKSASRYYFDYTFKTPSHQSRTWSWSFKKQYAEKLDKQFGVPPSFFRPYRVTRSVLKRRREIMKRGLYKRYGRTVVPDKVALVNHFMPLMAPIYRIYRKECRKLGYTKKRERIELLMSFFQDIHYGVPPKVYDGRHISGLLPPVSAYVHKWADCDTKAIMFGSVLAHDPAVKFAFISVPGHALIGIYEPVPRPYDKHITYRGKKYIMCEPVGTRRTKLGRGNRHYSTIKRVEPMVVTAKRVALGDAGRPKPEPEPEPDVTPKTPDKTYLATIRLVNNNRVLRSQKVYIYAGKGHINHRGSSHKLRQQNDGWYHYKADDPDFWVFFGVPGFYIRSSLRFPSGRDRVSVTYNFKKGNILWVKTKPHGMVYVFKQKPNKKYKGYRYKASRTGNLRLILSRGRYNVSRTKRLSENYVDIDYFRKKGATVDL